jgi:hypothetical protein
MHLFTPVILLYNKLITKVLLIIEMSTFSP